MSTLIEPVALPVSRLVIVTSRLLKPGFVIVKRNECGAWLSELGSVVAAVPALPFVVPESTRAFDAMLVLNRPFRPNRAAFVPASASPLRALSVRGVPGLMLVPFAVAFRTAVVPCWRTYRRRSR